MRKKRISSLLSSLIIFSMGTQIAFADPIVETGGDIPKGKLFFGLPEKDDGKPYDKQKADMTVEDRVNQYTVTIAGLMGEAQGSLDADILLDGEYNITFGSEDGGETLHSAFDDGATFNYGSIQETVYFFLRRQGFSAASAAGIMGNIQQECSFNPGLEEVTISEKKGYGLMQWTGGRRIALENFAKSQGKPSNDVQTQLAYFLTEIAPVDSNYNVKLIGIKLKEIANIPPSGSPLKGAAALKAFKNLNNPVVAADVFCWGFERPGKPHIENRRAYARSYYDRFSNLSVPEGEGKGTKKNQKDRANRKDMDIAVYLAMKKGDLLESKEKKYMQEAMAFGIGEGFSNSTRIDLLKRIERMKGARFSKAKDRAEKGTYDAPAFVDRTTAYLTGYTTMGQKLIDGTDVYEKGFAPFLTYGKKWILSRYNVKEPIIKNPEKKVVKDKNGKDQEVDELEGVRFLEIERKDLKPGDLCFVKTKEKNHVAFYMGGGRVFGAMNEALGVNWSKYKGGQALDYYDRFYRTLRLRPMDEDQVRKAKEDEKKFLATLRDEKSGRAGGDGLNLDREVDELGNPLYQENEEDWKPLSPP